MKTPTTIQNGDGWDNAVGRGIRRQEGRHMERRQTQKGLTTTTTTMGNLAAATTTTHSQRDFDDDDDDDEEAQPHT